MSVLDGYPQAVGTVLFIVPTMLQIRPNGMVANKNKTKAFFIEIVYFYFVYNSQVVVAYINI